MTSPTASHPIHWTGALALHGRTVLTNRRYCTPEHPNNTLLFDSSLFLCDTAGEYSDPISGVLSYFKHAGEEFSDKNEPEVYDISANITLMPKEFPNLDAALQPDTEYAFIGEIFRMDFVGTVNDVDVKRRPIICGSGIITAFDAGTRIFEMTPMPYIPWARTVKAGCPLMVTIPRTPRWEKLPPIKVGGYVSFDGYFVSIIRDGEGYTTTFMVEVEKVTLLGKLNNAPIKVPAIPATPTPSGKKRTSFNYADTPMPKRQRKTQ